MTNTLKSVWVMVRLRLQAELVFRTDAIFGFLASLLGIGFGLLFFEVIYGRVESVGGWSKPAAVALVGTLALLMELENGLFGGIQRLRAMVREGRLEQYLLRPVACPPLFVSQGVNVLAVWRFIVPLVVLGYALTLSPQPVERLLLYSASFVVSLGIYTLMIFSLVCLSFWLVEMNNLFYVVYDLMEFGRYPLTVYQGIMRVIFTTILPVALLSSFPTQLLMLGGSPVMLAYQSLVLIGFYGLARLLWRKGLRRYQGAGA
jgi:ABC-2 type transport system permease protein